MKLLVALAAILAVSAAAPTGKSWGVPISLAPQRISYNYVPAYYVPVHLQRIVAPAPAPVIIPYSSGGSSRYHVQDEYGQYQYGYVNADGQAKTEIRGIDGSVAGKFSYYDPNGKHIELKYVADKDGFRAVGDHLPKQVELPDHLEDAYEEAKERIVQTRRATAIRQAYRAQKAAQEAYQAAARSYSFTRPPTVYVASYPQAAKPQLVQTYAQAIPAQTRVVVPVAAPAQTRIVQTYVPQPKLVAAPITQPRPTYVQPVQTYVQTPVVVPAPSVDDGGAEEEDDDDEDDHDDGKYDHEKHEQQVAEHDDGKYKPEDDDDHHDDGQYRHDDTGDDDDDDHGDGESDGDDTKAHGTGVIAVVPGQAVVGTPAGAVHRIYTAPAPVPLAPVSGAVGVASSGIYVAQTRPVIQAPLGVARPAAYPAPATVGVVRPTVYSVQAPTPAQASVSVPRPAIYSAPATPSVSVVRPVYSSPVPVQSPTAGVVHRTYTSAAGPGTPVSFSVSQPVAPPQGSPVIATKVKTYTSTGTVGSPYAALGGGTAGAPGRLSSYSVSAQIPVSSVPVATPQVTVPVYAGPGHTASGAPGYKSHATSASGPVGVVGSGPAVITPQHPTSIFGAAPQAATPAGHVKSGYNYPG